jgi:hypothetical protein
MLLGIALTNSKLSSRIRAKNCSSGPKIKQATNKQQARGGDEPRAENVGPPKTVAIRRVNKEAGNTPRKEEPEVE